jgi:putative CocE/NonD family hydrolase
VQLWRAKGSRETYLAGTFDRYDATDWPIPGTNWTSLWLSAASSGQGLTLNQGSLANSRPSASTSQSYAAIPTIPSASDVPNTGFFGPQGRDYAATALPLLTDTRLAQPLSLSYTSEPLKSSLISAGPAALDLRLSSSAPETELWAVISDVWPDGSSHPLTTGRLLSSFPKIVAARSLTDAAGNVVQPYGDYSSKSYAVPGTARNYQIEFWPIGNVFRAGDRIQLTVLGASAASLLGLPAINSVEIGGANAARLLLPVVP